METAQNTATISPHDERWESPEMEVICLACEISAYAPVDEGPLF